MNEHQFGNKVRQLLNQGLRVDSGIAARLKAAREQALERQRAEPAAGLAWAGNVVGILGGWGGVSLRVFLPALMLVAALAGIYTWQQNQRLAEVEEIDALLLTDDLPVEAYLDRGFQNWLKKRAASSDG
jgi:hypothetical protein